MATDRTKIRITWNGAGGELDSATVIVDNNKPHEDHLVTDALIALVSGQIVSPGDSFVITEVAA